MEYALAEDSESPMNALEHLEHFLGPVHRGWSSNEAPPGVQVGLFRGQPFEDNATYATIGLSDHQLQMKGGRGVRQELVFSVHDRYLSDEWPALLFFVAERLLRGHQALLRGDVVPLSSPLRQGSRAQCLYTSNPVISHDGFAALEATEPPTVFAWLFPIVESERKLILSKGWGEFEARLEDKNPDLLDVMRQD
jgi:Suppressor of fused protein (SUFU)